MNSEFEVRVARMEERVDHMADSVDRIERAIEQLRDLVNKMDRTLAQSEDHVRTMSAQWKRIDDLGDEIARLHAFRNHMRGAIWAIGVMLTTLGGVGAAAILWLFASTAHNEAVNSVQEHRLGDLERRMEQGILPKRL